MVPGTQQALCDLSCVHPCQSIVAVQNRPVLPQSNYTESRYEASKVPNSLHTDAVASSLLLVLLRVLHIIMVINYQYYYLSLGGYRYLSQVKAGQELQSIIESAWTWESVRPGCVLSQLFSLTVSDLLNLCKPQLPQCRKTILRIKRTMVLI